MVTGVDRLLYLPYQLIRRPLAVLDEHAIKKLPSGNPVRELYHAGLRLADGIVRVDRSHSAEPGRAGDDVAEPDSGAAEDDAAEPDQGAEEREQAEAEREQAEEQRRHEFAKKEEQITRGNRSPAKMARELAQLRAAEEAREHEAAGTVGDSTD